MMSEEIKRYEDVQTYSNCYPENTSCINKKINSFKDIKNECIFTEVVHDSFSIKESVSKVLEFDIHTKLPFDAKDILSIKDITTKCSCSKLKSNINIRSINGLEPPFASFLNKRNGFTEIDLSFIKKTLNNSHNKSDEIIIDQEIDIFGELSIDIWGTAVLKDNSKSKFYVNKIVNIGTKNYNSNIYMDSQKDIIKIRKFPRVSICSDNSVINPSLTEYCKVHSSFILPFDCESIKINSDKTDTVKVNGLVTFYLTCLVVTKSLIQLCVLTI